MTGCWHADNLAETIDNSMLACAPDCRQFGAKPCAVQEGQARRSTSRRLARIGLENGSESQKQMEQQGQGAHA